MSLKQTIVYAALGVFAVAMVGCSNEPNKPNKPDERGQTMTATEIELTDVNFDNEASEGVMLVDFWAPWCGPCLTQGPIVAKVAAVVQGKARVGKCNVDQASKTATRFGIQSIPTLIVLKDGSEVERFVGVRGDAELISAIERHLE